MVLEGHCNCKAISITINSPDTKESPLTSTYCHCTTCRRQSGASGCYVVIADNKDVVIKDPHGKKRAWKDTLTDSGTPLERTFCGECGCPLTSITPLMEGKTIVKMGLFDTIPKATTEVYTKNKQSWEPKYEGVEEHKAAPQ